MAISLPLDWLSAMMLAAVRVTAFIVIAPPFSHNSIPARIKAMIGALTAAIIPATDEIRSVSSRISQMAA